MRIMQKIWYKVQITSIKNHNYTTHMITQQIWLYNKYKYITSLKNHDYIYKINDRKSLISGVGK